MTLFQTLLALHIMGGGLSLLAGGVVMVLPKGDPRHARLGRVYFWALLLASAVAIPMCYLHPNYFLFVIAVFTAYMLITGLRYLRHVGPFGPSALDWGLTTTMLVFGLAFLGLGAQRLLEGSSFGWVLATFGAISLQFVWQDVRNFRGKSPIRNFGLTTHLQRMVGSYIASVTAFLVVNIEFLPPVLIWLAPTAVLVPLILVWTRRWAVKLA